MPKHDETPRPTKDGAWLACDACRVAVGPFGSYEAWSDEASRLGWLIGEEVVLCTLCS